MVDLTPKGLISVHAAGFESIPSIATAEVSGGIETIKTGTSFEIVNAAAQSVAERISTVCDRSVHDNFRQELFTLCSLFRNHIWLSDRLRMKRLHSKISSEFGSIT